MKGYDNTTTVREINEAVKDARKAGKNFYWVPNDRKVEYGIRITHARTRGGEKQVHALGSGEWYTVVPGDTFWER